MNSEATVLSYIAGKCGNQTENLATEALAFILRRSFSARTALRSIAQQFGCPCPEDLTFETQISNEDGSRPDVVGKSSDDNVRVIIEAKFWAGLTEAQPVSYLRGSRLSEGGILLFVAPELRLQTLWPELLRRVVGAGYPLSQTSVQGLGRYVGIGRHILGLLSWRLLLDILIQYVDSAGDLKSSADLRQLVGLCDQMDSEAFLPLTSEEMTSTLGLRVVQFCQLAYELTDTLVSRGYADVSRLKATGGHAWYGRYMRLKGYAAVLQFSAWNWSKWGDSPLWLGIQGEDWKPSAKVREALVGASIQFRQDEEHGYCFIPILLSTSVERETVIANAITQIEWILKALPPAAGILVSEPPPNLTQLESEVSIKQT